MPTHTDFEVHTQVVPGYTLTQFLGSGGYGDVWEAETQEGLRKALKFIPCSHRNSAAREIRAVQAIAQLRHPHLLRVEQVLAREQFVVVVMELAEGSFSDLADAFAEEGKPLSPSQWLHFFRQAASVLDFLNSRVHRIHGQRVAIRHGDVKPGNLLLCDGVVKLSDFSLACPAISPFSSRSPSGTPPYCAPEVFSGWISDRTDQYALAVSYYQLRTGRLPFAASLDSFHQPPRGKPDLSLLDPSERAVVAKALSSAPQDRWNSCTEFVDRLGDVTARRPRSTPGGSA